MRVHPVAISEGGDVLVDTDRLVKRPQGFHADQFTPATAGASSLVGSA
jgi:hypothetical protein